MVSQITSLASKLREFFSHLEIIEAFCKGKKLGENPIWFVRLRENRNGQWRGLVTSCLLLV